MSIFSSDEILDIIKEYSKTPAGRSAIKEQMKRKRDFVPKYADKKAGLHTFKQIKAAAEEMADILFYHITHDTVTTGYDAHGNPYTRVGLSEFKRSDIIVHYPHNAGEGAFEVNISFDVSALHRDSLSDRYDGIDDIVQLFVHGYKDAKGSVHGVWHGIEVTTKRNREAMPKFMQNAVDEFNAKYKEKAKASLKPDYMPDNKRR